MISHGVDVERFNMMVFFGMPRQTAEYIQSSSRAGRSHPGLVFNVFHPIRERDLSHYHFFEKYHQFLDR
ncbi:MAG: helicase-related protein, partial [Halobacteriaceae archaeon]